MRLVGTLPNEDQAKRFSTLLAKEDIEHTIEMQMDPLHQNFSYAIWIHDEDDLGSAKELFQQFSLHPEKFTTLEEIIPKTYTEQPSKGKIAKTSFFTLLCILISSFVFVLNFIEQKAIMKEKSLSKANFYTPIQIKTLMDAPDIITAYNDLIFHAHFDPNIPISSQPIDIQKALANMSQIPLWKGFYGALLDKWKKVTPTLDLDQPILTQVRQGEVWRLISPAFLHINFFHILFNMLWLWFLGKAVEERLPKLSYMFLVIFIAIGSNLTQYAMTGFNFMGFSGVVFGLFGYVWVRQKIAPWGGFVLSKSMVFYLLFYMLALVLLSLASFFLELFDVGINLLNIGNAGHISGALLGMLFGKYQFLIFRRAA